MPKTLPRRRGFLPALAIVLAVAMSVPAAHAPISAAPSSTASIPKSAKVASSFEVQAAPGIRQSGRLAVVETTSPVRGIELGRTYVTSDGKVKIRTSIPVAGKYGVRVRVLDGRKTSWQSSPVDMTITAGGKRPSTSDSGRGVRIVGHARNAESPTISPRGLSILNNESILADLDEIAAGPAASSEVLTNLGTVISGALNTPLGQFIGAAAGEWGVAFGLNLLMSVVFPGSNANTGQALQQISNDLQQVQNELNDIESSLSSLEVQVTQEYAQLNAVESDSLCISLLNEANGYVDTIQLAHDNMQLAMTPSWLQANVGPYANSMSGIRAIGNQVFGTGSGTPSFSSGVFSTQLAVTGLGNLLSNDGVAGSTGLVSACSTAIAAELAANQAGLQSPGTNITPVGAVDNQYFVQMQQIIGFYAGWTAIGQAITAQGGQMIVASLSPAPITSASQVTNLCNGATASATPNLITCSGILAQIAQTQASLAIGWNLTGASWGMVSDGVFAADTQVNPAAGGLASPSAIWPIDLGGYGLGGGPGPLAPSTGRASGPASAILNETGPTTVMTPAVTSWLGLNFGPATSSMWDRLLQVSSLSPYSGATATSATACVPSSNGSFTSCAAPQSVGAIMYSAGLLANKQQPSNLIIYTGETSTWNPLNSAVITDERLWDYFPFNNVYSGLQPPIINSTPNYSIQTFLDTQLIPVQGASAVIGNPSTSVLTLTPASIYPYYTSPGSEDSWTATLSQSLTSSNGGNVSGNVIISCPATQSTNNPFPTAVPLTYGPLLNVGNGQTGTAGGSYSAIASGSCTQAPASTVPLSGLALTNNPTFYSPITAAGTNNPQGNGESFASLSWNTTNVPGFMASKPQAQYVWPVANPAAPGCTLTSFSEGVSGQANTTQTCVNLWQEFSAIYNAQTFGSVTVGGPLTQGTIQQSGSNLATVVFTNSSSTSQSSTLTVATTTPGIQVQSLVTPVTGSNVTLSNCAPTSETANALAPSVSGATIISCAIVVPPGVSAVNIPVTYTSAQSGGVIATITGSQSASAVQINISNTPGFSQVPPAPVTNLGVSASSGNAVTLTWQTPASTPPLLSYVVTSTGPTGTSSSTTVPISSVTTAGQNSSATVQLQSNQAGYWQFTVAGQNIAGNGLAGTTTTYIGSGPPPAPANLIANENPDGTVSLSWTPITSMPPVSGYTVIVTGPDGIPRRPVTVSVPAFTTSALTSTGTWSFAVSATNTSGTGPQSTTSVPLLGAAPSAPEGLVATVSSSGSVSATWSASPNAVPPPTSYTLRVFDSSGRLVRALTIPTTGLLSTIAVPDFFSLGSNSPTGTWIVAVSARNATGAGPTARSILQVTPGVISGIGRTQSIDSELGQVPVLLSDLDATECRAGFLTSSAFGTCNKRVWKPN